MEKLWITDKELADLCGGKDAEPVIRMLEAKCGFPKKDALWGGRRYFPAVKAYLDRLYGPKGESSNGTAVYSGGPRARLAAAAARVGSEVASSLERRAQRLPAQDT